MASLIGRRHNAMARSKLSAVTCRRHQEWGGDMNSIRAGFRAMSARRRTLLGEDLHECGRTQPIISRPKTAILLATLTGMRK